MGPATYVSLNSVYLISRRNFPVSAKTFSYFQYILMYTRPFNGIFSYSKIEIPEIYMFKVDKNCRRCRYFTELLMFLFLTLNIIFPSDIYILYCFYSSLLEYSKKQLDWNIILEISKKMHTRVPWNKLNSSQLLFSWTPPNVYLWNNYLSQSQTTWGLEHMTFFRTRLFFIFLGYKERGNLNFSGRGWHPAGHFQGL